MVVAFLVIILLSILFIAIGCAPEREESRCGAKAPSTIPPSANVKPVTLKDATDVKALATGGAPYKKPYTPSGESQTYYKSGYSMRNTHPFHFLGGEELAQMGATWFVSYCYHRHVDYGYDAWRRVKTAAMRRTVYERTEKYHAYWLRQVLDMDDARLNTNRMHVSARDTKRMARELLASADFTNN